jgi:predicted amidophosphoribosyltransferase
LSIPEAVLRFGAHLLWPGACPFCGALGVPACLACLLPLLSPPLPADLGSLPLESGGSHEGVLRDLVLELKYGRNRPLGVVMGRALGRIFPKPPCDVLVPVPLHRDSERGYNQSVALAGGISKEWDVPVADVLQWNGLRSAQTSLEEGERRSMPPDALIARGKGISGQRAVLVDDVSTTGTTLRRAARAVAGAGGKAVLAITWTVAPKA